MTEEQARSKATERVFVYMNRGDIENNCKSRGIKVVKSRYSMEEKLIDAIAKEYIQSESE